MARAANLSGFYRNLELAMENYFNDSEKYIKKYGKPKPKIPVPPPADKPSDFDTFFNQYAGKEWRIQNFTWVVKGSDFIDWDGLIKFYTDLGVGLDDVVTVVIPYYCKMESPVKN